MTTLQMTTKMLDLPILRGSYPHVSQIGNGASFRSALTQLQENEYKLTAFYPPCIIQTSDPHSGITKPNSLRFRIACVMESAEYEAIVKAGFWFEAMEQLEEWLQ